MQREYSQGFVVKHRNKWRAIVNWQDENGKQRRLTKSTGIRCYPDKVSDDTGAVTPDNRGKASAEIFLRSWRDELVEAERERVRLEEASSDSTFAEYAELYIQHKEIAKNVRPVTLKGYRSYLGKIIGTPLGDTPLRDLSPKAIASWEHDLSSEGIGGTSLSHIHVFAKQVCTYARRMGDISSNPFDLVDAPKRKKKPINSLSGTEVAKLNEALRGFGPSPLAIGVRIALSTGMRQGEICALRWSDIDLDSKAIRVNHSLSRDSGKYRLCEPKTEGSLRTIPCGDILMGNLIDRKKAMALEREEFGLPWDDSLFVIGSAVNGKWYSPQVLGHEWHALARSINLIGTQGIPPRFHDLRHTFATLAISSSSGNLDVKTVSAILGHSNAAMTLNVYADALEDSKKSGMEVMDKILSR